MTQMPIALPGANKHWAHEPVALQIAAVPQPSSIPDAGAGNGWLAREERPLTC